MRQDALLINTSRGPIVDEAALLDALTTGSIGGAGLDVFDVEPLPTGHPLRTAPRDAADTARRLRDRGDLPGMFAQAVEDIEAWLDGAPVRALGG